MTISLKTNLRATCPAFTLLELTVAIAIIGVFLTLVSINYRSSNSRSVLVMSAYQIASDARLMQGYAASARQLKTNTPPDNQWGIYFDKDQPGQYLLFVDQNDNAVYDSTDFTWKTVKMPKSTSIFKLFKANGSSVVGGAQDKISVVYVPPQPTSSIQIYKDGNNSNQWSSTDEVLIQISNDNTTVGKEVYLNFYGLIDVVK